MKAPVRSRTLWTSIPGAALFLGDAIQGFIQHGGLDDICAQKSALAGILLTAVAVLRFFTTQSIIQPKEGADDRSNPEGID